ncbi:Alpha-ketoglutarate-dependent dioxygenase AlkB-like [Trinorchestia longiramus]|nr:Alpha-ketoglutarate-dependent dioxygenase AlkB-like [Trinorchestia longiramus]
MGSPLWGKFFRERSSVSLPPAASTPTRTTVVRTSAFILEYCGIKEFSPAATDGANAMSDADRRKATLTMEQNLDNFRPVFKYYKSKNPRPDLSQVMDVNADTPLLAGVRLLSAASSSHDCRSYCSQGLRPPQHWRVFTLQDHPGLLVVRGAFTPEGEMFWAAKCLMEYPDPPNINNIENIKNVVYNSDSGNQNCLSISGGAKDCTNTDRSDISCSINDVHNSNTSEKCYSSFSSSNINGNVINCPSSQGAVNADCNIRNHKNTISRKNDGISDTSAINFKDATAADDKATTNFKDYGVTDDKATKKLKDHAAADDKATTNFKDYAAADVKISPSEMSRNSDRQLSVNDEIKISACSTGVFAGSNVSTASRMPDNLQEPVNQECVTPNINTSCLQAQPTSSGWWKSLMDSTACKQLRWATLGYHHHWHSKRYSENRRSPFPSCLYRLSSVIASTLADFLRVHEEISSGTLPVLSLAAQKEENYQCLVHQTSCRELGVRDETKMSDVTCRKMEHSLSCVSSTSDKNFVSDGRVTKADLVMTSSQKCAEMSLCHERRVDSNPCFSSAHLVATGMADHDESKTSDATTAQKNIDTDPNVMKSMPKSSVLSCDVSDKCVHLHNMLEAKKCISSNAHETADDFPVLHQVTSDQLESFKAEAAIVNYYHPGTSLGPHTDHSEPLYTAPLLSISLGQPCVFLIGGPTKATPPTPLALRSGDVIVMGGAARMSYHAVPCVSNTPCWVDMGGRDDLGMERPQLCGDPCPRCGENLPAVADTELRDVQWEHVRQYLDGNRINMNVRQIGKLPEYSDH